MSLNQPVDECGSDGLLYFCLMVHVRWVNFPLQFWFYHILLDWVAVLGHMVHIVQCLPITFHHLFNYLVIPSLGHRLQLLVYWDLGQLFRRSRSQRVWRLFRVRVIFSCWVYRSHSGVGSSRLLREVFALAHLIKPWSDYHWGMCELLGLVSIAWKGRVSNPILEGLLVEVAQGSWLSQHLILDSHVVYVRLVICNKLCWLLISEDKNNLQNKKFILTASGFLLWY